MPSNVPSGKLLFRGMISFSSSTLKGEVCPLWAQLACPFRALNFSTTRRAIPVPVGLALHERGNPPNGFEDTIHVPFGLKT